MTILMAPVDAVVRPVRYVRTRRGKMIHRDDCYTLRHAKHAMPWHWADEHDQTWIVAMAALFGYLSCKHCCPLTPWIDMGYIDEG